MRSFRHWSPRYIADRLGLFFLQLRNPDAPWLTSAAIVVLDTWLRLTDKGIELDFGRSIRWLGRRVAAHLSIEHDKSWHARVSRTLPPCFYYRMLGGEACVEAGRDAPASSLDFVLSVGLYHLRDRCALVAIERLRPGGLLIIDSANWFIPHATRSPSSAASPPTPWWAGIATVLADWRCIWTSSGVTDTGSWIKLPPPT